MDLSRAAEMTPQVESAIVTTVPGSGAQILRVDEYFAANAAGERIRKLREAGTDAGWALSNGVR